MHQCRTNTVARNPGSCPLVPTTGICCRDDNGLLSVCHVGQRLAQVEWDPSD